MSSGNIGGGGHGGSSSSSTTTNDIFLGFKKASQRFASAVADTGAKTLLKVRDIVFGSLVLLSVGWWKLVLEPRY
jgi:hypothetical protein